MFLRTTEVKHKNNLYLLINNIAFNIIVTIVTNSFNKLCSLILKFISITGPRFFLGSTSVDSDSNFKHTVDLVLSDKKSKKDLTDAEFYEWFRGFTDGEGCFMISPRGRNFAFSFIIYLHKDDTKLLEYIQNRLSIGKVNRGNHFTSFYVFSQKEITVIISIFNKYPLNTSKNLNFLNWKEGFELYTNKAVKSEFSSNEIITKLLNLKNSANRNRTNFQQPVNHKINITPYWFLGFLEGESYFSVARNENLRLEFGVGQTMTEKPVILEIQQFLMNLPEAYKLYNKKGNPVH